MSVAVSNVFRIDFDHLEVVERSFFLSTEESSFMECSNSNF